jgi:hypothetical protein
MTRRRKYFNATDQREATRAYQRAYYETHKAEYAAYGKEYRRRHTASSSSGGPYKNRRKLESLFERSQSDHALIAYKIQRTDPMKLEKYINDVLNNKRFYARGDR